MKKEKLRVKRFLKNGNVEINSSRSGLCFRCEHRARYYEEGIASRYECGDVNMGVHSCYMYKPVRGVITRLQKGDRRPRLAGAIISAREEFVRVADKVKLTAVLTNKKKKEIMLFWIPESKVGEIEDGIAPKIQHFDARGPNEKEN